MAKLNKEMFPQEMIDATAKQLGITGKTPELHIADNEDEVRKMGELSKKHPVLMATFASTSTKWWHEVIGSLNTHVIFSKGRPAGAPVGVAMVYLGVPDKTSTKDTTNTDELKNKLAQAQLKIKELETNKSTVDLSDLNTVTSDKKPLSRENVAPEASITIQKLLDVGLRQSEIARRVNITSTQVRRLSQSNYGDYNKRKQLNEALFEIAKEVGVAND